MTPPVELQETAQLTGIDLLKEVLRGKRHRHLEDGEEVSIFICNGQHIRGTESEHLREQFHIYIGPKNPEGPNVYTEYYEVTPGLITINQLNRGMFSSQHMELKIAFLVPEGARWTKVLELNSARPRFRDALLTISSTVESCLPQGARAKQTILPGIDNP